MLSSSPVRDSPPPWKVLKSAGAVACNRAPPAGEQALPTRGHQVGETPGRVDKLPGALQYQPSGRRRYGGGTGTRSGSGCYTGS